jgi:ABC-type glycerol-3-phosphate transport system substrate-binding protein
MNKKLGIFLSVLLLLSVFASACSNNSKDTGSTGNSKNSNTAKTSSEEDVTLKMWTWKVAYVPGLEAAAKLFEEETGVKIEIETFTPDDTYRQKFLAAANTGNLPDIIHWWAGTNDSIETSVAELSGQYKDDTLSKFFTPAMSPIKITQEQVDTWQADDNATVVRKSLKAGEFYGLPLDIGGFFTFYGNKKLITDAGLEPVAPKTWEEFVKMMETIKKKTDVPGLVFGAKLPDLWENWAGSALSIMYNGPQGYIDLLERNAKMTEPKNLKVVNALGTLVEKDLLMPGILATDIDGGDQAFAAGKAAFNLGGSFTMSTLLAMGMNPDDFIAFPIPPLEGSQINEWATDPFTLTMMSVNDKSAHKDLGLQFIEFITTNPEASIAFANGAYTVPALILDGRSDELTPNLKAIADSFASEAGAYSEADPFIRAHRGDNKEWEIYFSSLQSMMEKKMTAQQVAQSFDDAMEDLKASGN